MFHAYYPCTCFASSVNVVTNEKVKYHVLGINIVKNLYIKFYSYKLINEVYVFFFLTFLTYQGFNYDLNFKLEFIHSMLILNLLLIYLSIVTIL